MSLPPTAPPDMAQAFEEMECANGLGWEWMSGRRQSTPLSAGMFLYWGIINVAWNGDTASYADVLISGFGNGGNCVTTAQLCLKDEQQEMISLEYVSDESGQQSWRTYKQARIAAEAALERGRKRPR